MSVASHQIFGQHIVEKNKLTFQCLSKLYVLADHCHEAPLNQHPKLVENIKKAREAIDIKLEEEFKILDGHPQQEQLISERKLSIKEDLNNIYDSDFRKLLADMALKINEEK